MATQGGKSSQEGPRESIWNVDHGSVSERIGARRERIKKRIEAAKRLTRLMKIQKMMGFRGEDEEEAFVKVATDSGNIEIHGMTNSGQELVSNVRLAGEFLQVIQAVTMLFILKLVRLSTEMRETIRRGASRGSWRGRSRTWRRSLLL